MNFTILQKVRHSWKSLRKMSKSLRNLSGLLVTRLTFNVMQQLHSRQQLGTMFLVKNAQVIQVSGLQFLEQFQVLVAANGTIGETIQQKYCW